MRNAETAILGLGIIALWITVFIAVALTGVRIIWLIIRDHRDAVKYRELVALLAAQQKKSATGGWQLTYKDGRATRTVTVQGTTEAEAMQDALRTQRISYDKIVSLVKV